MIKPTKTVAAPLVWTDDRCQELDDLGTLLREVASINSGSGWIDRIERCIALAEKLNRDDLLKSRDSLHSFLRGLAIADRERICASGAMSGQSQRETKGQ